MVNYYGVSIPSELSGYQKIPVENSRPVNSNDYADIAVKRNYDGELLYVNYYNNDKELIKQIYYDGVAISKIKHYKSGALYIEESYKEDLLSVKNVYSKDTSLAYTIKYEYTRDRKIQKLTKLERGNCITAVYGYDDFGHISSREITYNSKKILSQRFKYDILDRIVEYSDENQMISVKNMTRKNQLLSYKITDKIGNEIEVNNYLAEFEYLRSEVTLNGHSVVVKDKSYVDNVMLKRPYATEDDLDIVIANLLNSHSPTVCSTNRTDYNNVVESKSANMIESNIVTRTLPISMRKRVLYNIVTNSNI